MRIQYDPSLIEEVISREVKRKEEEGDLSLFQEYRASADPIYEKFPPNAREAEFEKLHRRLFLKWGFGEVLKKALKEHPELEGVEEIFVGKAVTRGEEGANVSRDRRRVGIRVRPERFFDPQGLLRHLRHELQHVADMLDPAFGSPFEEGFPATSPAEANLIRDRYRMIWAITIDGRLEQRGKEPGASKEERRREFEALYQKIPYAQRLAIFESLWGTGRLTHGEILAMAKDPAGLVKRVGEATVESQPSKLKFPGSLCPLCRFPTSSWAEELDEGVTEKIRRDFPEWDPEEGACERCIEVYSLGISVQPSAVSFQQRDP